MTLVPGSTLGNYQIIEKVGAGGMGSVYKAYQPALGRYVAIKVLPPQTAGDPSFAERFALEARAIGKLRHPNIVTAYDFSSSGDLAYLVSDFIDGGTLADQLGAPLPLDYALAILTPMASALDYAHARGVVHRDIKPQNILLTHEGTPVLTDFGLAKIIGPGSGVTQAGALMGTAEYIAPECASGAESAGPAADQYAMAIVAYQMLVGRHPFPSENPLSALMAHVHKPVPVPSAIGIPLGPNVESALLRGLAKKPTERFARVGDFVRALSGSAPQTAPPPTADAAAQAPNPSLPQPASTPRLPPARPSLSFSTASPTRASWWRRRRTIGLGAGIVIILLVLSALNNQNRAGGGAVADDYGNTIATATVITVGTRTGTLAPAGDIDMFRVNVPANTNIAVELHFGTLPRGSVAILSGTGQALDEASDAAPRLARASYNAKDAGGYYIRVASDRTDATGTYSIVVTTR
ncbi:MAG: serine/threonine protein kinase [Chloroflexi bacterium]|nr:MAG: serine/threonine protein kinase [Chloroflexota bacterium]